MGEVTVGGTPPCVVGLTGGLASGKSSVARLLAARGVPCRDADEIVHRLYAPGAAGTAAVRALFGDRVLDPDGGVDRERLGGLVLADDGARTALERAIHPLVRAEIRAWLQALGARRPSVPVAVVEAALLVETGSFRDYDVLVVVWCRAEQQLERAVARGVSEERARAVLAAQLPLDAKREAADVVIDNSGEADALAAELVRAWDEVARRCATRATGPPT